MKGEGQVIFSKALKELNLCESLRAQKGCHTIPPRRILTQKGATAANKTFNPTLVGGGPLREGIRFQGNVSKIEFLEALSVDDYKSAEQRQSHCANLNQKMSVFQL